MLRSYDKDAADTSLAHLLHSDADPFNHCNCFLLTAKLPFCYPYVDPAYLTQSKVLTNHATA